MSNSITQEVQYKQTVVEYSYRHGVTKAAIKFKMYRKTIYRWRERYDGTAKSLKDKSRRPHRHPNEHTEEEIKMIKEYKNKNKETGLVVLWVKLQRAGYTRSITSLYRVMQRIGIYKKTPSKKKKYEPKPYQQMTYPGERIQIDVKYVPKEIQTDNGIEFTYNQSQVKKEHPLDKLLKELEIKHHKIMPRTPEHNGKVERSHRNDNERFYSYLEFYSLEDLRRQGAAYLKRSNKIPMAVLGYLTPKEKRAELELIAA